VIRVRGLTKRYREGAGIEAFDLDVDSGEIVALVGPNGAGKSTALRAIAGQILPDAAEVTIDGKDLHRDPLAVKACTSFLPQEPVLYPYLTGEEFLRFMARVRGVEDIGPALAVCDLGPAVLRLVREYSYGMQKRLAFAGALLVAPKALLLDEVFAGLDPVASAGVASALRGARDRGAAVLLSGHELASVMALADRVAVLARGRLARLLGREEVLALRAATDRLDDAFREMTAARD
jgi:ABC-type multidrug transport system ATPase subunit